MKILSASYYSDSDGHEQMLVVTDEGDLRLSACALKLRLVLAGFVFVGEESKFADREIVLPAKWAGNDSEMRLHGFTAHPVIVALAQRFVEAVSADTFRCGPVPIPTEPPMIVNAIQMETKPQKSITWRDK